MRQVRLALGPDALIISNRRVSGGVEILATDSSAVDDAESHVQSQTPASAPPSPSATPSPSAPPQLPPQGERPAMPSPMSPLGAYAAAFQAAYGPAGEQSKPVAASQPAATHQPAVSSQPPASAPPPSTGSAGPNIIDVLGDLRGSLENRID